MPEFSVFQTHDILDTTGLDATMQFWIVYGHQTKILQKNFLLTPSEWDPKLAAEQRRRVLEKNVLL